MKFKYIIILLSGLFIMSQDGMGQGSKIRNNYGWSLGVQAGATAAYSDVSYKFLPPNWRDLSNMNQSFDSRAAEVVLSKRLNNALGLSLSGMYGNVTGNDRTYWLGKNVLENPSFARSLNFRTEFYMMDVSLVYNMANGFLIRNNAKFAPYIGIGAGATSFFVFGDLYTKEGSRYFYWSDNTVRNLAENDPNAALATEISQDKQYETRLTNYKVEGNNYSTIALQIPVTLGVKTRIADRWDLSLSASARYLFTDYFDDISGKYPVSGNPSAQESYFLNPNPNWKPGEYRGDPKMNDVVGFVGIGIHHRFGLQLRKFKGPRFYSQEVVRTPPKPVTPQAPVVPVNETKEVTINVNNQESVVLMEKQMEELNAIRSENAETSKAIEALTSELSELKKENAKMEANSSQPVNDNPEIAARAKILEMRMDSIRDKEIAFQDRKISDLDARIAKMEISMISGARVDTVGLSDLKKEKTKATNTKDKLRRQKRAENAEMKKMQSEMDALNAKIESISNQPKVVEKDPEVVLLRMEIERMKAELEKVRNSQQPVQIYNTQPAIQQPAAPQAPVIIQAPAPQVINSQNNEGLNRTLMEINKNLEVMSSRIATLENKNTPAPVVNTPPPVIVNQPAPIVNTPAPVINNPAAINVGFNKASVFFSNGSSVIPAKYFDVLDAVVAESQKDSRVFLSILGYASKSGSAALNNRLSKERSEAVRNYLIRKGVMPDRVSIESFGSSYSTSPGELDRRVDIMLLSR
ncbi:MAG: OmpA family protein [Bacteroidia bacterium]|nr:OmpA family protein [Bacteroidia bacterium]